MDREPLVARGGYSQRLSYLGNPSPVATVHLFFGVGGVSDTVPLC